MKKLDHKNVRCRIAYCIRRDLYKLELLEGISQLHNVFHTSLLWPNLNDPLPSQYKEPLAPIRVPNELGENEGFHNEWNIEEILNSKWYYGHLEYKVKWEGFPIKPWK